MKVILLYWILLLEVEPVEAAEAPVAYLEPPPEAKEVGVA